MTACYYRAALLIALSIAASPGHAGSSSPPSEGLSRLEASAEAEAVYRQGLEDMDEWRTMPLPADPSLPRSAAANFEHAASLGHAGAAFELGAMLSAGVVVPKDEPRALDLLRKAAAAGHPAALNALGVRYDLGDGVEQNNALAWTHYADAARLGDDSAPGNLRSLTDRIDPPLRVVAEATSGFETPSSDAAVVLALPKGKRVLQVKARSDGWTAVQVEGTWWVVFVRDASLESASADTLPAPRTPK